MKYYEVEFTISPCTQDARDILSAMAGEAGFETFEETDDGLNGYVQQKLFNQQALDIVLESFPFESTHIIYKVSEAEDRDWNEQWEQEGFEPIIVRGERKEERGEKYVPSTILVIHDGRHLPTDDSLPSPQFSLHSPLSSLLFIEIDAHLAFGTGTHETTRMICSTLLDMNVKGKRTLDCGCGTGILAICTLKLGAAHCTAYDIDEWSSDNTRHNAVINHVDDRLDVMHGDATLLDTIDSRFDILMANINRNILLQDMERFVSVMNDGGTLILSGFYEADIPLLEDKAKTLGLTLLLTRKEGEWACMVLQ